MLECVEKGMEEVWKRVTAVTTFHIQKIQSPPPGRFPVNLIHDGSTEATQGMGENSRYFYCAKASQQDRNEGLKGIEKKERIRQDLAGEKKNAFSKNFHNTVKPTDLMRYLCRLVTPPNGRILDPFMGSGSTGKAAILEGFRFYGIDLNSEYVEIAGARIKHAEIMEQNEVLQKSREKVNSQRKKRKRKRRK